MNCHVLQDEMDIFHQRKNRTEMHTNWRVAINDVLQTYDCVFSYLLSNQDENPQIIQ